MSEAVGWDTAIRRFERSLGNRHTRGSYLRSIEQLREAVGARRPADVGPPDVVRFVVYLRDMKGNGARSVSQKLSAVRSFYSILQDDGLVQRNPARRVRGPRVDRALPEWLTMEQMNAVLRVAEGRADAGGLAELRDLALVELAYGCGARVGELVALDIGDVDLREALVRIRSGKGNKERVVPTTRASIRAIERWLPRRARFLNRTGRTTSSLFIGTRSGGSGRRLTTRSVQERFKPLYLAATGSDRYTPHTLRHTCATHMMERAREMGADALMAVKEQLGHEYLSSTAIYCHLSTKGMLQVFQHAHPRALDPEERPTRSADVVDEGRKDMLACLADMERADALRLLEQVGMPIGDENPVALLRRTVQSVWRRRTTRGARR